MGYIAILFLSNTCFVHHRKRSLRVDLDFTLIGQEFDEDKTRLVQITKLQTSRL